MHPVVCMITDRRRDGDAWERALVLRVAAAARGGAHLVQVREPDLDGASLTNLVRSCVQAVHGTLTRVVVNDRLDVALACGAHGVHLRADSMPADRVRSAVGRPFLIGRSVHDSDEAARAGAGADYLIAGTAFASGSKPDALPIGLEGLAAIVARTRLPVLAVGGMTARRFADVTGVGAAGGAAIGLFADTAPDRVEALVQALVCLPRSS